MDNHELFRACRRGDIEKVRFLIEQRDIDLNVRDRWDSSPLYYACLCGHAEVVQFLMDNGARCEANTFDGERCLYGALSKDIRDMLKNYKVITSSTMRRDIYHEFLRRLFERGELVDITFKIHGVMFRAHRCILMARSQYFDELLRSKWSNKRTVSLNHKLLVPTAFRAMLQYLYTGCLEVHVDDFYDVMRLAKYCNLTRLQRKLQDQLKHVVSFESTKPGVSVTMVSLEPLLGDLSLNEDYGVLANRALPSGFCGYESLDLPFPPEDLESYADVIFDVEGHQFKCHKIFFCLRSDYFKAMLADHFGENTVDELGDLPVVHIHDTTAAIFVLVMNYIYQDFCELTEETVFDTLYIAELYLLHGLKRLCATTIGQMLDVDNVVSVLRMCRLLNLRRLEDQCAEFISNNLEKMVEDEEFAKFVKEDAADVESREEADTISIVDDVRFHISNCVQTFSDMYEADQKLSVIDNFLQELGLEG